MDFDLKLKSLNNFWFQVKDLSIQLTVNKSRVNSAYLSGGLRIKLELKRNTRWTSTPST